jgi:hypothetical protein
VGAFSAEELLGVAECLHMRALWRPSSGGRAGALYEFYGRGRDLYHAIRIATKHPPNGYVDVDARDFIENPQEYCVSGAWI